MTDELREALDYIDSAIDAIRGYIRRLGREPDETLEDVLYHLEEAGELLDSLLAGMDKQ